MKSGVDIDVDFLSFLSVIGGIMIWNRIKATIFSFSNSEKEETASEEETSSTGHGGAENSDPQVTIETTRSNAQSTADTDTASFRSETVVVKHAFGFPSDNRCIPISSQAVVSMTNTRSGYVAMWCRNTCYNLKYKLIHFTLIVYSIVPMTKLLLFQTIYVTLSTFKPTFYVEREKTTSTFA